MTDLIVTEQGAAGRATLNRPKALNAITHQMLLDLEIAMRDWAANDNVKIALIDAVGDRAFCAGGDIVDLYNEGVQGRDEMARTFWRDEYRINAAVDAYPKPYVAIMDGIVMGGGVGISAHGSHRIVTERTMFAMPECAIGIIPDVGGSLLLARMPGHCGEYAGLTGARLSGADCIYAGLADFYVESDKLDALKTALCETGDTKVILQFSSTPPISALEVNINEINTLFNEDNVKSIQSNLQNATTEFAQKAAKGLSHGAPLGLISALKTIQMARADNNMATALRNEYRFVTNAVATGEFIEGVRAAVIDKDRNPNWKYPTLDNVPTELIGALDHPAPDGDFIA
jgi:enoyl-CoA hydratase